MLRRRIPGRRGDGVRLGRTRWRSLPPFVSAWTRIKTLKTRLLIASVLQAASAILYAKRCPRAGVSQVWIRFLTLYRLPADTVRKPCKLPDS